MYRNKVFDGGYTYFKANKKSQIDFVVTNNSGRKNVENGKLVTSGWHFSDHLPIDLTIRSEYHINVLAVYIRCKALITPDEHFSHKITLKSNRNIIDINKAKRMLMDNAEKLTANSYTYNSAEKITDDIHTLLDIIIKETSFVKRRVTDCKHDGMKECDRIFNIYLEELYKTPCDVEKTRKFYNHYQEKRNELNHKWSNASKI